MHTAARNICTTVPAAVSAPMVSAKCGRDLALSLKPYRGMDLSELPNPCRCRWFSPTSAALPSIPPTLMAALLLEAGVSPWITLSCRDRNRVVLEQELRGLSLLGVQTVLCVTGDGRAYDVRPDVTQTFDLDGPRLVALAASLGVTAAVPETITAPPVSERPARLVAKQHAGADVAVLNHTSIPGVVADFLAAARVTGLTIPVLGAVAVVTDALSAAVLRGLPGLELDPVVVASILDADDPVQAGIDAAVAEARALLAIDGVEGVNISGLASADGTQAGAEIKAEVGHRVREEAAGGQ